MYCKLYVKIVGQQALFFFEKLRMYVNVLLPAVTVQCASRSHLQLCMNVYVLLVRISRYFWMATSALLVRWHWCPPTGNCAVVRTTAHSHEECA